MQSFLNAIRADMEDDTVRLVFADYLDEFGIDAEWADVIRTQVEIAKHGPERIKIQLHEGQGVNIHNEGDGHFSITWLLNADPPEYGTRVDVLVHRPLKKSKWIYGAKVVKAIVGNDSIWDGKLVLRCDEQSVKCPSHAHRLHEKVILPEFIRRCESLRPRCWQCRGRGSVLAVTGDMLQCPACDSNGYLDLGVKFVRGMPVIATEPHNICSAYDLRSWFHDLINQWPITVTAHHVEPFQYGLWYIWHLSEANTHTVSNLYPYLFHRVKLPLHNSSLCKHAESADAAITALNDAIKEIVRESSLTSC